MNDIRLLKLSEIEVRVQSVKGTAKSVGCVLLLYKDARVDMKLLDEIYGPMNWQRTHEVINGNLFCNIEVWDEVKNCWVKKQDVGVESNTEKEKGQASDAFKRAGFNWGIGRELYTSPFIWIELKEGEYYEKEEKGQKKYYLSPNVKFTVKSIGYNDEREISALEIKDNRNIVRYKLGEVLKTPQKAAEPPKPASNTNPQPVPNSGSDELLQCLECRAKITKAVHDFSVKFYGHQYCPTCQKKHTKIA